MLTYILLIGWILFGHLLFMGKVINKRFYCISVCIFMIIISGFRAENVGMWDTTSVYLPSFRVVNSHSLVELLAMRDTQYKFIGFDLYSKLIGLISHNENFYIFMVAWPFYVSVTYLINKYTQKPMYSFIALLALGYFTYSFSMIRGMLGFAALAFALDAAIEERWKAFLVWTLIATSFHITSLLFLSVYLLKRIKWSISKIAFIYLAVFALQEILPSVWQWFVRTFIQNIIPTYNYYGIKGGELADMLLLIYITVGLVAIIKVWLKERNRFGVRFRRQTFVIKLHKKKDRIVVEDTRINLLIGMAVGGTIIIFLTSILSEMIRIAMVFGLGSIVLAGSELYSSKSKTVIRLAEFMEIVIFLVYFILATLPNMNAIPYRFFWN